jgi:hypothetical protein
MGFNRRQFLKMAGIGAAAGLSPVPQFLIDSFKQQTAPPPKIEGGDTGPVPKGTVFRHAVIMKAEHYYDNPEGVLREAKKCLVDWGVWKCRRIRRRPKDVRFYHTEDDYGTNYGVAIQITV